jgi:hypothetical protein
MNDKDKEAFEEWKNKTEFTFEFQIEGEKIEVPPLFKEWFIGGMGVSWQAACEYKQYEEVIESMLKDMSWLCSLIPFHQLNKEEKEKISIIMERLSERH